MEKEELATSLCSTYDHLRFHRISSGAVCARPAVQHNATQVFTQRRKPKFDYFPSTSSSVSFHSPVQH